jgi:ABC-type cobalamin/Fe3+-siderophores transport system ATPase subunit
MENGYDSNKELFETGTVWVKADFHLHTWKDKEFTYPGEENRFINDYISKLKELDIRVGIITNHNKFDLDEFKALRRKARSEKIFLLPGVELFVNDGANGIHTLVIFSGQWISNGNDYINQFLMETFRGKSKAFFEQANERSNDNLIETIKKLEGYQKDFMLIFAHVENKSGLWNELAGGRIGELGKNEFFRRRTMGFQKVRTVDVPDRSCKKKVQDWLKDWYPAEVEGSDCKSIEEIGKGDHCFIKIGDFTFEAVKYALRDHRNRIAKQKPQYRHSHIRSISYEGGVLNGQTIHFSPGLNTLIGIRGSGKSSVLETLRYVLDIPFGEQALDQEYKENLIAHTLSSGGKAVVKAVDRHGKEFEIQRILNEYPDVYSAGTLQPGLKIRETIIYKPIYFGQKDLSNTGEGFEKSLVEKLVGEKLAEVRKKIIEQQQRVIEVIDRLNKLSAADEQKKEFEGKKQDAEFRLKTFKKLGVEEKLQGQADFETDSRKIKQIIGAAKNYLSEYAEFINRFEDELNNLKFYNSRQNPSFFAEFISIYEEIADSIRENKKNLEKGQNSFVKLKNKADEFEEIRKGLKEEFAGMERKLAEQLKESGALSIRPDDFLKLRKTVDQSIQMLEALEKQQLQRKALKDELQRELTELNNLWHEEFKTIQTELQKINENQPALEITSEFKGDKKSFIKFMKDTFKGSRIREAVFQSLAERFVDFAQMALNFAHVREELGTNLEAFEKFFKENLKMMITWQKPNKYTIKYRSKELKDHSLGQRASALILFILSRHDSDLILIDQPEDDLDNQTIYEDVIKFIRKMKCKTQFIFVTHNANFPVLGDGEQVHSCRYSDEQIQLKSGSIDNPAIQEEIVNIMEGGQEAFNKRKEIYTIWNPQNF